MYRKHRCHNGFALGRAKLARGQGLASLHRGLGMACNKADMILLVVKGLQMPHKFTKAASIVVRQANLQHDSETAPAGIKVAGTRHEVMLRVWELPY